jgi:hypothetical protein
MKRKLVDNGEIIIIIIQIMTVIKKFIYLFTCLLNIPKANYKMSTSKDGNKETHIYEQRRKTKQDNLDNNKNSISTIAPAIMRQEKNMNINTGEKR